jgi:hypothetical protein
VNVIVATNAMMATIANHGVVLVNHTDLFRQPVGDAVTRRSVQPPRGPHSVCTLSLVNYNSDGTALHYKFCVQYDDVPVV